MLVEINLLPQKEPKKMTLIITLSSLLAILLIVSGFYLWQINSTKDEIAAIDRQISMTTKVVEKTTQAAQSNESANSLNQLKTAIDWANEYPIQSVPVMRHITALLPERGFIQSFGYTEEGSITLTVQFDNTREAAFFLDNLNESNWVQEADLSSLSAVALPEAETSSQTTTGNASVDANTQNQNSGSDLNNNADQNTSNPSVAAGDTNDTQTTNNNSVSNSNLTATTSTSTESKKINNDILPRYNGQYEIKLNKDVMKELINKDKNTVEGGTGS
ncbi:hypothetical protein [Neobacillus kokaensis]|uniref:Fimbrial assembly protein n=1 Tax=Neobacillus kokaensis TaxID=2759023 RepID=A0ABQ3MWZ8_9BACI|nr:hypothetical protein [Neobacillus kokaensis]GHH97184.1 hypothetical protein AM1BK_07270 [Neobacillus kokaensis]